MIKFQVTKRKLQVFSIMLASALVAGAVLRFLFASAIEAELQQAIVKAEQRLGQPIQIEHIDVGFGSAVLENVVIGPAAEVIISEVRCDLIINPLSASFGQLGSVVIDRARFKRTLTASRESSFRHDAVEPALKITTISEFFAKLPFAKNLVIKTSGITVVDDRNTPLLNLRGIQFFLTKESQRMKIQVSRLQWREKLDLKNLRIRLAQAAGGKRYRFKIRKGGQQDVWLARGWLKDDLSKAHMEIAASGIGDHSLGKQVKTRDHNFNLDLLSKLSIERQPSGDFAFYGTFAFENLTMRHSFLSPTPIGPLSLGMIARGHIDPKLKQLNIHRGQISLPIGSGPKIRGEEIIPINFTLAGGPHAYLLGPSSWQVQLDLPPTHCQKFFDAVPDALRQKITEFNLAGQIQQGLALSFSTLAPEEFAFRWDTNRFTCSPVAIPEQYSPAYINEQLAAPTALTENFYSIAGDRSYTPLANISKNIITAFSTAEDASFWYHKGVDGSALENALRKNITAKKVVIGGSTITMQTAKNLFLSHERTLSRKIQELFLAWHLESMFSKARIFEIYLNIIEFGPGIYGISNAAKHYFAKYPLDINLKEAAFLATLLPSPKKRHRHFCNDEMSPKFAELVDDLLRRMRSLGRVSLESYSRALRTPVVFNQKARYSADSCAAYSQNTLSVTPKHP